MKSLSTAGLVSASATAIVLIAILATTLLRDASPVLSEGAFVATLVATIVAFVLVNGYVSAATLAHLLRMRRSTGKN